jgi:hypothetical protein
MTALGYAVVGGRAALDPLLAAAARVSRATLWQLGGAHGSVLVHPRMTMAVVAGAVALALYLRARDQDPSAAVGAALVAYLLTAPYVLPWYAGWALPVLATTWRTRLSRVGLTHAALLLVVYVDAPGLDPDALHNAMRIISGVTLPVLEGVAVIGLVAAACRPQLLAHVRTGSHSAHTVVKR